ncbi:MAG: universal stress protein [Thermodesulfobacteriota bacterium]
MAAAPTPERRLLVTVSGDVSALWGARFVGGFLDRKDPVRLTLWHMVPRPLQAGAPDPSQEAETARRGCELREEGAQALAQAAEVLAGLGFPPDRIETRVSFSAGLKIEQLLVEAGRGDFDAVVLGRRGLSWYEALFAGSLTRDMLQLSVATPVWVCREPESGRSGALLCLDGSAPSLRMAAHLGRVLAREDRHPVTLFQVAGKAQAGPKGTEEIFAEGREALEAAGLDPARIREQAVCDDDVSRAILRRAAEGRHAVVAVGCTGTGRGFLEELFAGSVSSSLLKSLKGAALWVSH